MQEKCRKIPAVFPPNLLHRKRYTHPYWGITVGYVCTFKFTPQWKKKSKSNRNQASPVYSLIWRRTNFQIRLDFKSQHNYRHSLIDNKQLSPQQRPCNKKRAVREAWGGEGGIRSAVSDASVLDARRSVTRYPFSLELLCTPKPEARIR